MHGLVTELLDLAGRVLAFKGGEVDHVEGELEGCDLAFLLDGARLELRDPLLHANLIDGDDMAWIKGGYHTGCRHVAKIGIDNGKLKMEDGKWHRATRRPPAARGSTARLWRGGWV
jgi:hypothetical protein